MNFFDYIMRIAVLKNINLPVLFIFALLICNLGHCKRDIDYLKQHIKSKISSLDSINIAQSIPSLTGQKLLDGEYNLADQSSEISNFLYDIFKHDSALTEVGFNHIGVYQVLSTGASEPVETSSDQDYSHRYIVLFKESTQEKLIIDAATSDYMKRGHCFIGQPLELSQMLENLLEKNATQYKFRYHLLSHEDLKDSEIVINGYILEKNNTLKEAATLLLQHWYGANFYHLHRSQREDPPINKL